MNHHFGSDFDDFLLEYGILESCSLVAQERIYLYSTQLALGEWVKTCPLCGNILRKTNPQEPWYCSCGWTTSE